MYSGGYIHVPVPLDQNNSFNDSTGYPYNKANCSKSCSSSSASSLSSTVENFSFFDLNNNPLTSSYSSSPRYAAGEDYYCSDHCINNCIDHLTENENKQKNLCCHWHDKVDNSDDAYSCNNDCGQVENMSNCGVIFKDVDNGKSGTLVCTRSCDQRCPVFRDSTNNKSVIAFDNYMPHPTIFQQPPPRKNCEGGDIDFQCDILSSGVTLPWQNCVYQLSDFEGASQSLIESFETNQYGGGKKDRNFDTIMTNWCSEQIEASDGICPADAITGYTNTKCARMLAQNGEGIKCRNWLSDKEDHGEKRNFEDAVAAKYCGNYPSSTECKCYSRGLVKQYQDVKSAAPYNDGCWYMPCSQTYKGYYFVPSDVDVTLNPNMCPSDVCLTFINADGYNSVYVDDNREYINCDFESKDS